MEENKLPPTATEVLPATADPESHQKNLLDVVPYAMVQYIEKIPPELFEMTETELEQYCYPKHRRQDTKGTRNAPESVYQTDTKLRLAFWNEYERAVTVGRRMQAQFIFGQTIHSQNFYKRVCSDPKRLAWVICPPGDYQARLTNSLNEGIKRLDEIFRMPIAQTTCRCHYGCVCKHPDGLTRIQCKNEGIQIPCACKPSCICPPKYDSRVADVILKALEKVEMRVKGAVIQKIDERRMQVNLFGKVSQDRQETDEKELPQLPTNMDDIERRIKELEQQTKTPSLSPASESIDVLDAEFTESKDPEAP